MSKNDKTYTDHATHHGDKITRSYLDYLSPRISYFLPRLHDDDEIKNLKEQPQIDEIPEVSSDED